jgi:ABC-type phosphate transport system substrate-binding protein
VFIRYRPTSSPRGESAFANADTPFAFVSQPLSSSSVSTIRFADRSFAYAPIVGSGLAFGFRIEDATTGQPVTQLKLTPEQLAKIFTGQLHDLGDDPGIVAQNPGVDFPPVVRAVGRADPSAQSRLLTSWFLAVARHAYRAGGAAYAGQATETYPGSGDITLLSGARSVAHAVADPTADASDVATVGWMDSSVAATFDLPTVLVRNASGRFVAPTVASISNAIRRMSVNTDGVTSTPNFKTREPGAYPLPVVTYLVTQTNVTKDFDQTQAGPIRAFIRTAADANDADRNDADRTLLPDGYAPLPDAMTSDARRAAADLPTTSYEPPSSTGGQTPGGTGGGSLGGYGGYGGSGGFGGSGGSCGGSGGSGGFGGSTGSGGSSGGTGSGGATGGPPTATPTPAVAPELLPETALTASNTRFAWPIVLFGGLGLVIIGGVMTLALALAARHGERQALAAAGLEDPEPGGDLP